MKAYERGEGNKPSGNHRAVLGGGSREACAGNGQICTVNGAANEAENSQPMAAPYAASATLESGNLANDFSRLEASEGGMCRK